MFSGIVPCVVPHHFSRKLPGKGEGRGPLKQTQLAQVTVLEQRTITTLAKIYPKGLPSLVSAQVKETQSWSSNQD
jgi:hypothetical protein